MEKFTFFLRGPLSQWVKSQFIVDGIIYCNAEQYMMAQKAIIFNDKEIFEQIMATTSPKEHQALGRQVRGFNQEIWNKVARDVVYIGNYSKFSQNEDLKKILFDTYGTTLVEASPTDLIWGCGFEENDSRILDRAQWLGKNWLGETLTKVREALIESEK